MASSHYHLIADIGGTNARFALVAPGSLSPQTPRSLPCKNYETVVDAVTAYLHVVDNPTVTRAAFAVASPVTDDVISMTNNHWRFSVDETRGALALDDFRVVNDFTSLALSLPYLTKQDLKKVGSGDVIDKRPKAVIGPGTGLGVSGLVPVDDHWLPLAGEGGHISYGPLTGREADVINLLREDRDHISAEYLVSGAGLVTLYNALMQLDKQPTSELEPHEVTHRALQEDDALAQEALNMFCSILGTVAGNLGLTLGAHGGVYIGGGIVPRIMDFFRKSDFRERFEQHGRFTAYLQEIATHVIMADYPALTGSAVALGQHYASVGVSSSA